MFMMPWELFGYLRVAQTAYKPNGMDWMEIAKQDPRRIVLEFAFSDNPSGFRLSCTPVAAIANGKFIPSGNNPICYCNTSHALLTQLSWQAFSINIPADVVVTEIFLDKDPCQKEKV